MTAGDIYGILDRFAPFASQESYDRAGFLAGSRDIEVTRVLVTLDITRDVAREAADRGAQLILAHHPVIWEPIRTLTPEHPVWILARYGIAAICAHTNLDVAPRGLNARFGGALSEKLGFCAAPEPLIARADGTALGLYARLRVPLKPEEIAARLREMFPQVRFCRGNDAPIDAVAWCTGSGGDLLADTAAAGAGALITGDCKHSVWMEAQNRALALFDCGHFATEVAVMELFEDILRENAPEIEVLRSEAGSRPPYEIL